MVKYQWNLSGLIHKPCVSSFENGDKRCAGDNRVFYQSRYYGFASVMMRRVMLFSTSRPTDRSLSRVEKTSLQCFLQWGTSFRLTITTLSIYNMKLSIIYYIHTSKITRSLITPSLKVYVLINTTHNTANITVLQILNNGKLFCKRP